MMGLRSLVSLLVAAVGLAGCSSVYRVPTTELEKLDGWEYRERSLVESVAETVSGSDEPVLYDVDGDEHEMDDDLELVLRTGADREVAHSYRRVDLTPDLFVGIPSDAAPTPVEVPRAEIDFAGVRRFSWPKTLLLVGGVALAATVGLVVLALSVDADGGGDGDDDFFDD